MIQLHDIPYDACRRYVDDYLQDQEFRPLILGWCRARNLKRLASASDLLKSREGHSNRGELFQHLRQVEAFFKKVSAFSDEDACEEAASTSFRRGERICRITNKRLDWYWFHKDRLNPILRSQISRAVSYVEKVLGSLDVFRSNLPDYIKITSGASAEASRRNSLPHLKIRKRGLHVTPGGFPYVDALSMYFGYGHIYKPKIVQCNRVEYVPKNWKTHRTIACEPGGVLPLQLAFDMYCKGRLRKVGIDLSDQSRNQGLAKEGSISGIYSTIDLSMASDTLAFNTVAWLLPEPWFKYLADIRCAYGALPSGEIVRYAKFSSMGNGATFALETLIFSSLCYAVGSRGFSVYGDDIVIEEEFAFPLLQLLRFFGFIPNEEKTFLSGPFRESCGKDWYEGRLVTPFYIRELDKRKAFLSHIVNGLLSICLPYGTLSDYCRQLIVDYKLAYVPWSHDTTTGVHVDIHSAYKLRLIKMVYGGQLRYKAYCPQAETVRVEDNRTLFLWYLKSRIPRKSHLETATVPLMTHRYKRRWVSFSIPIQDGGVAPTPPHLYWWGESVTAG